MLVELCEAEAEELKSPELKDFANRLTDQEHNWRLKQTTQSLFFRAGNIEGAQAYRLNYLEYLEAAWASHHAIRLTPDIMWYTLLCELTQIVADDPEKFRYLFSESDDKQTIVIEHGDPVVMPLDALIGMLEGLVPTDTAKFLPEFSTTTDRSRHAFHAAFCDMVSPYYDYMMLLCGIPAIEVLGTVEDWTRVRDCWAGMQDNVLADQSDYYDRVLHILNAVIESVEEPDPEFWKTIFYLERCGSGHQTEAFGWFTELFRKDPSPRYVKNFPSHVSTVKYKQLNFNKDYEMKVGLFTANVEDGIIVPDFGFMVYERTEPVVEQQDEPERKMEITTTTVKAKPRKLAMGWTIEQGELTSLTGDDVDVGALIVHEQEDTPGLEPGFFYAPYVPVLRPAIINGEEVKTDFDLPDSETAITEKFGGLILRETDVSDVIPPAIKGDDGTT